MEDETGLGLLTGMVYETRNYLIYPVVNAQNLVVQNFPSLAEENTDKMQEIYGNGTKDVNRDIVWPSIAAIYRKIILVLPVWWHQNWIMMLRQKQMASCCIIMRSCSTKKRRDGTFRFYRIRNIRKGKIRRRSELHAEKSFGFYFSSFSVET